MNAKAPESAQSSKQKAHKNRAQRLIEGFISLAFTALIIFVFGTWYANKYLDKEISTLEKDLQNFQSKVLKRKSAKESLSGNAASDYLAIEYILDPRESWKDKKPEGMSQVLFVHAEQLTRKEFQSLRSSAFALKKLDDKTRTALKRFSYITKFSRSALSREKCDWQYPIHRMFDSQLDWAGTGTSAFQTLTYLLVCEALFLPADQQVRTALDIIALGQDCAFHSNPTAATKSAIIKSAGFKLLEKALNDSPSTACLEQSLKSLESIGLIDRDRVFQSIRIAHRAFIARLRDQLSGHSKNTITRDWKDFKPYGLRVRSTIFLAWEWGYSHSIFTSVEEFMARPYLERRINRQAFSKDLASTHSVFGKVAIPQLLNLLDFELEPNTRQELLRCLIAAELYRRKNGKEAGSLEELKEALGGQIPMDPYLDGKAPLRLKVQGDTLSCYSVYLNSKDDSAEAKKDLLVSLKKR
jgi:hypothetical protein